MNKLTSAAKSQFTKNGKIHVNYYMNRDYTSPEILIFNSLEECIDFIGHIYENQNDDISIG